MKIALAIGGCKCLRIFALVAALQAATTASAQEVKSDSAKDSQPGWTISCAAKNPDAAMQCQMVQELFAAESRALVLAVTIVKAGRADGGLDMILGLPHGFYLPAGVAIKIDDAEPIKAPIESSNQSGVFARIAVDEKFGAALKRGKSMLVAVTNRAGNPVQIPVNLNGFTAAFNRVVTIK